MDRIRDVNFTNVPNNHHATFSNGPTQVHKTHRMEDLGQAEEEEEVEVHLRLEAASRIRLAIMEIVTAIKVKLKVRNHLHFVIFFKLLDFVRYNVFRSMFSL